MKRVYEIEEELLRQYLADHLTYKEMAEKFGCSHWTVMSRANELGLHSDARKHQMKNDNPMAKAECREKVKGRIVEMWQNGHYADRINGMLGVSGRAHPNTKPEGSFSSYREKAAFYHPEAVCLACGKQCNYEDKSLEVHHVDRDHGNLLLTNLMPLCHSCHRKYHRKSQYTASITKSFVFDACHYLPFHGKKCKFLHGHTYHLDVTVKNAVLLESGMVMDFGLLKKAVQESVIDKFDHGFINEHITYPTAELMVSWIWFALSRDVKGLTRIDLWETDGSKCTIDAESMKYYLTHFEGDWIE